MSRIGKQSINVPTEVSIEIKDNVITVKGPKGELSYDYGHSVSVALKEDGDIKEITVKNTNNSKLSRSLWGTTRALIQNMIIGVTEEFKKVLELHGVGYKMSVQGQKLILNLGFSHPIELEIPKGLSAEIDKEKLSISGIDKQKVGQFAAEIRALRKVEPYKGKGFRYEGEQFIKKEGKKAAGSE